MKNSNELFIKTIRLNREKVNDFNIYPFNIDIIKNDFNNLKTENLDNIIDLVIMDAIN